MEVQCECNLRQIWKLTLPFRFCKDCANSCIKLQLINLDFRVMLLINLIFEFCVIIEQAGYSTRAWLPSDLATSPLLCTQYILTLCGSYGSVGHCMLPYIVEIFKRFIFQKFRW